MKKVLFMNRLRSGVREEDCEGWVREVDYPKARSIPSIISYEVVGLEDAFRDSPIDCDYVEIVTVSDIDEYRRHLAEVADWEEFIGELRSFIEPAEASYGTAVA